MIFAHTNLAAFELCPRQFEHKYVLKDLPKEAPSPALKEGRDAHQAFEARLKNRTPLPEAYQAFESYCLSVEAYAPLVELELGMTEEGQPAGFWQADAWLRGKVDVAAVQNSEATYRGGTVSFYQQAWGTQQAVLLDWKTGKRREDPDELEIFGLLFTVNFPLVKHVAGCYIWLKENRVGEIYDLTPSEESFARLKARTERVEAAIAAKFFPPIESWACSFCAVRECQFNRRRD